eukprot:13844250-Heterocapsa_arctica.AAC.1
MWSKIHAQWSSDSAFKSHTLAQVEEQFADSIDEFTGQEEGDVVFAESDSEYEGSDSTVEKAGEEDELTLDLHYTFE